MIIQLSSLANWWTESGLEGIKEECKILLKEMAKVGVGIMPLLVCWIEIC